MVRRNPRRNNQKLASLNFLYCSGQTAAAPSVASVICETLANFPPFGGVTGDAAPSIKPRVNSNLRRKVTVFREL